MTNGAENDHVYRAGVSPATPEITAAHGENTAPQPNMTRIPRLVAGQFHQCNSTLDVVMGPGTVTVKPANDEREHDDGRHQQ